MFFSYLGNFEYHLSIFPRASPPHTKYTFLHSLAFSWIIDSRAENLRHVRDRMNNGVTRERLQAPRCSYFHCSREAKERASSDKSMMYVARSTEHHNCAICISPANAHTRDHIRLPFGSNVFQS